MTAPVEVLVERVLRLLNEKRIKLNKERKERFELRNKMEFRLLCFFSFWKVYCVWLLISKLVYGDV